MDELICETVQTSGIDTIKSSDVGDELLIISGIPDEDDSFEIVAYVPYFGSESHEDAERIVACINAMRGVPDPALFMQAVFNLILAAVHGVEGVEACFDEDYLEERLTPPGEAPEAHGHS